MTQIETLAAWFDAYQIDHRVMWQDNKPASISPIGKLSVSKIGNYWSVNGKRVSRKFGQALATYYA